MKGKNGDNPLPLFDYITWSKYHANIIKNNASPNKITIDKRSEYLV